MANTTQKNEVQVVLEEYLGRRKATKVAEEISAVKQEESQHTHNGRSFYIHTDKTGALVLTEESMVESQVKRILTSWLEEDEVEECLQQLMGVNPVNNTDGVFETITVEGSGSECYTALMTHTPKTEREMKFMKNLETAINAEVKSFRVPVNDPSIDKKGKLQFVAGCKPAVGYSYNELEELAKASGVRLGTRDEYCLFLGSLLIRLMAEGWSEKGAWEEVCDNSKELGHYWDSADAKRDFEPTGSRMIAGKCDLANTFKVLAKDKGAGVFWLAGGYYGNVGNGNPLADLGLCDDFDNHNFSCSVGWFVL